MTCCFECEAQAEHAHHVVPKSLGGTRTVPLCTKCHGLVHDRQFLNHVRLTKEGLARAKANGKRLGRPAGTCGREDVPADARVVELHREGLSLRGICARLEAEGYRTPAAGQKRKPKGGDRFARKAAVDGSRWYPTTVKRMLERQQVLSVRADAEAAQLAAAGGDSFARPQTVESGRWYPTSVKRMLARKAVR